MENETLSIADFIAEPEAFIRRAHAMGCPVVDTDMGPMAVTQEAVRELLRSPRTRPAFSLVLQSWGVTSGAFYEWMSRSPLDMDGDRHREWRRLMARIFTPHSVEKLRPALAREAAGLSRALCARGQCEFIADFARVLPAIGLCELIGVPVEDRERFGVWCDTIGFGFNPVLAPTHIAEIDAALLALFDYVRALVEVRRGAPGDDFISNLIRVADETGALDSDLLVGSVAGLVFAGHETTKNQLGWMVVLLSEREAEWERVARQPQRALAVVEEVLRLRSTATAVGRLALQDVDLLGRTIPEGTPIIGSLWAANRDPQAFGCPHAFDVDAHEGQAHVAFGQGVHHCLGAALARLELQEALKALSARITCPRVLPGATFLPPIGINGPSRLPIQFAARP